MSGILVANRGEIALRILRAAGELGLAAVAVRTPDDPAFPGLRRAREIRELPGEGVAGYLDADAILAVAADTGVTAVHPGYGFLSENAAFAARCAEAGITFVGPRPELLELFGDKARARGLAGEAGVPVTPGTAGPVSLAEARAFAEEHGPVMLKALAGGGGRGMRAVTDPDALPAAYERCRSEALGAFGAGDLYVERYVPRARHIEVQIAGDGTGAVTHLWERDCSVQRRHQKLVEIAPAPALDPATRAAVIGAAERMARRVRYEGLGTFEFLVAGEEFWFLEVNPRLQVEHTVTEEITGVDLVQAQIRLALGARLADVGLDGPPPEPRATAIQVRINAEALDAAGTPRPGSGTLTAFAPPSGPGVRVDTHAHAGYRVGPRYDSLLAKVVVRAADLASAVTRASGALAEFEAAGVETTLPLLRAVLRHPGFASGAASGTCTTAFVADHLAELLETAAAESGGAGPAAEPDPEPEPAPGPGREPAAEAPAGTVAVPAPMQGTVVSVDVAEGDRVRAGAPVLVLEAMKMEHVVGATESGVVRLIAAAPGGTVAEGAPLLFLAPAGADGGDPAEDARSEAGHDPAEIRADLAEVRRRHEIGLDGARPEAVARRHARGRRTARENIGDLCDPETFTEYGALAVAAQRGRRTLEDLIARTPADGLVCGIGEIGGGRAVVMAYDYTVLAGTQGYQNHRKTDRMLELSRRLRLPLVLFAEGGGGRPGDTDTATVSGLDVPSFHAMGRLSGLVPLVGIASGRCFAGNAALLGCCDVIIATRDANIGMGGPAMIEGGGLGVFRPEEIGPVTDQEPNGVIDVLVEDDAEAVRAARDYLSYFQGPASAWTCGDQRLLRHVVPENRRRAYDVRRAVGLLADTGSVLELRRGFGAGVITALVRIEGRPMGLIASNPAHLGGAIDRDAADKAARFLQLCDAHGLPVVSLCDTPGFMVGPEAERTATVRHFSRLFVTGANLRVPIVTIVLRKGYGLGAQAMAGGSFKAPLATVAWPTGEIGGMGLEGAVRLGFRKELAEAEDPEALFASMVATAYEHGKALNAATVFELDDVIDPAGTRRWITAVLGAAPPAGDGPEPRRWIDTW
ncbi:carboxyl transferase domain-containing protein [Actinomadura viridis]|uniref:acetyl-CoA carboxylase n=1 Tax=Actinomadura viridis TaxID=58110 RepID=A0A931DDZ9_9ACTN|nr:carboxyl transferase domain-containing protein [Actinomadura viridis]MBG6089324.1 acetyl/propionyl-CoA carboxylase alpha subunit/acetyl-CoA carboxylase carboxyltransferase component [Actinomadura viridis]